MIYAEPLILRMRQALGQVFVDWAAESDMKNVMDFLADPTVSPGHKRAVITMLCVLVEMTGGAEDDDGA